MQELTGRNVTLVALAKYQEDRRKWGALWQRGAYALFVAPLVVQCVGGVFGGLFTWVASIVGDLAISLAWLLIELNDSIKRLKLYTEAYTPTRDEQGRYSFREQSGRVLVLCECRGQVSWRSLSEFVAIVNEQDNQEG